MPHASVRNEEALRPCWECSRREWTCDATRPVCNQCRAAGIVCPGYDDQKPLTWLAPGRVTFRTRRKKQLVSGTQSGSATVSAKPRSGTGTPPPRLGPQPPALLKSGLHMSTDATGITSSASSLAPDISRAVATISRIPRSLPDQTPLGINSPDLIEAAYYYNSYVYPNLVRNQLVPNPFVVPFVAVSHVPASLRHALISITLSHRIVQQSSDRDAAPLHEAFSDSSSELIVTTPPPLLGNGGAMSPPVPVNHNSPSSNSWALASVVQPPPANAVGPLANTWTRLHQHTGLGIRALNEQISDSSTRSSDATIAAVLAFLVAELHQSVSPLWKPHADGLMTLITLRGGLYELCKSAALLKPSLLSFVIVSVIANTTSPPTDLTTTAAHMDMMEYVSELYTMGVFPSLPCPLPLFTAIAKINHIRSQLVANPTLVTTYAIEVDLAAVRKQIATFAPGAWAQSHSQGRFKEWYLVGQVFQSAVSLYCEATLPPRVSLVPEPAIIEDILIREGPLDHRHRLFKLLPEALKFPGVRRGMVWPLVVAGVEAASGTNQEQQFIEKHLILMSRDTGASYPLVAKGLLSKYWASGKTRWDECFDQPYAILT